jgi:hypothetical protein
MENLRRMCLVSAIALAMTTVIVVMAVPEAEAGCIGDGGDAGSCLGWHWDEGGISSWCFGSYAGTHCTGGQG